MAGHHRLALLPVAVLLLVGLASAAAADPSDDVDVRIKVRYANAEESQWLDRWAAKNQASAARSGSGDFSVQPATVEESEWLNRMVANANKRAGGYDGRIEFDDDHPFGRVVVENMHSGSSKVDDDLKNQESHVERDDQEL